MPIIPGITEGGNGLMSGTPGAALVTTPPVGYPNTDVPEVDPASLDAVREAVGAPRSPLNTVAAALGNSVLVGGYTSQEPPTDTYTNRDGLHWINAALGRPFSKIDCFGHDGYSTTQLVDLHLSQMEQVPADVWILYGWLHNNLGANLPSATAIADTVRVLKAATGKPVLLFLDPLMPSYAGQPLARKAWQEFIAWALGEGPRTYRNLVPVPCHEGLVSRDPAVTLQTKSFSADGTHPTVLAALYGMLPAARRVLSPLFPPSGPTVNSNNDPTCVSYNPFLKGANADGGGGSGGNWWYTAAGASGSGPDAFFALAAGAGAAIAVSKVVHPDSSIGAAWDYGEPARSCTKVSMTTGAATGYFEFGIRDTSVVAWTSGGAVSAPFNIVKPTIANGCLYRVLVPGNLASGANPTASWTTQEGTTFVSGTATLLCIRDFRGKRVQGVADIYVDQATFAGKCGFEIYSRMTKGGVAGVGSSNAFYGLPNTIGTTASFGAVGGHVYLPPRLHIGTQYDRDVVVPLDVDGQVLKMAVWLDANSRVDMTFAHFGAYVV